MRGRLKKKRIAVQHNMTACKRIVLASNGDRSNDILSFIIVRMQMLRSGIDHKFVPSYQCVFNDLAYLITRLLYHGILLQHPYMKIVERTGGVIQPIGQLCLAC